MCEATYQLREPNFEGHQYVSQFYLDLLNIKVAEALPRGFMLCQEYKLEYAKEVLPPHIETLVFDFIKRSIVYDLKFDDCVSASIDMAYFNEAIQKQQAESKWREPLERAREDLEYIQYKLSHLEVDFIMCNSRLISFKNLPWWKRVWKAFRNGV